MATLSLRKERGLSGIKKQETFFRMFRAIDSGLPTRAQSFSLFMTVIPRERKATIHDPIC